jgi:hypothetical protein
MTALVRFSTEELSALVEAAVLLTSVEEEFILSSTP